MRSTLGTFVKAPGSAIPPRGVQPVPLEPVLGALPIGPILPTALTVDAIEAARHCLEGIAVRTPLIDLALPDGQGGVALKLETLQPVGSFKLRGAGAAMTAASRERLAAGVYTASAGNMAQGVAWCARALGVPCTVIVPEHAPQTKVAAVERLGASVIRVPFERWWQILVERSYPGQNGVFVHPTADADVITGNAGIALEILEDMPDVDTVFVPVGGGGLACGIAMGLRAKGSTARVMACEVDTAAPLTASLKAGGRLRSSIDQALSMESAGGACSPRCGRSSARS